MSKNLTKYSSTDIILERKQNMSKIYVIHNNKRKNDIKYECMNKEEESRANHILLIDKIENEKCEDFYYSVDNKNKSYNDSSCIMEKELSKKQKIVKKRRKVIC